MARKQTEEKTTETETKTDAASAEAAPAKARKSRAKSTKSAASAKSSAKTEKKASEKAPPKAAAETAPAAVNKTQAVKEFLAANPDVGPSEVSRALKAQGIEITPNYVSLIKTQMKKKGRAKAKTVAKAGAPVAKSEGLSIELLVKAKQADDALGGVEAARNALAELARLMD